MANSEIKKLPKSEVEIKVSVEWNDWKKYIDQAVADISKEIKVAGFRAGKAPRDVVEKKVGSNMILEEAAQKAIQGTYPQVLDKEKIEAIGQPKAEILKIAEGNEFEYKVVTAVVPEAQIKDWKDKIKKVNKEYENKKAEVSEEDLEKELSQLAQSRVQLVDVEREAKDGDSVMIDFQVKKQGVPIEGGSSKNHPLVLGKGVFIPGFEENVIGMKAGEEKEFELKFPEEYHEKSLAGNPATFSVKLNAVQERKTPEISDSFAKSLGKFETLEELKKNMKEGLLKEKEEQFKEKRRAEYIEKLVESTKAELPEVLVHEELHRMIGEFEMQLSGMGITFEKYLEQIKKTQDDVEKDWKPQAEKRIMAALALEKVAKETEIEVPAEKIEAEINKTIAQYKGVKDVEKNIDLAKLYNYVKGNLQNEEVFNFLEGLK
ncbi:MAG TPA: trigger factor [Candidatus Moranbacteria bacterium]|nr:MAG: Trigger factor [Parcubacteria group bacterium GW2011_GWC1_45_14]HAV11091.1 trigger factor [Candidatus Moranbacteria bacterium]